MSHPLWAEQISQTYRMAKYQVLALRKCTVEVKVVKQWFSTFHLLGSKLHLEKGNKFILKVCQLFNNVIYH